MDQGVVVVDAPPPLAKLPTPYHLFLLRLILLPCIYYSLFVDFKNDIDDYFYMRTIMMMIYALDTVCFGAGFMAKGVYAADPTGYGRKLAIFFGLRLVLNASGWALLVIFGVFPKGQSFGLACIVTAIVDCSLMMNYNEDFQRFMCDDSEDKRMEKEIVARYLYNEPWEPTSELYIRALLRVGVTILSIWSMLFAETDAIPSVHFPVRVFWCLVYIADNFYFFSRMYYANPQTNEELFNFIRDLKNFHVSRFTLAFLPSLYFSFFSVASLMSSCGLAINTALQLDREFIKEYEKYLKCQLNHKNK